MEHSETKNSLVVSPNVQWDKDSTKVDAQNVSQALIGIHRTSARFVREDRPQAVWVQVHVELAKCAPKTHTQNTSRTRDHSLCLVKCVQTKRSLLPVLRVFQLVSESLQENM